MKRHVRGALFDYLAGELPPGESREVEEHLSTCAACTEDLRILREAREILSRRPGTPSDERDELFWASFATGVEERIRREGAGRASAVGTIAGRITAFVQWNRFPLLAGSGALAAAALAFLLLRGPHETEPPETAAPETGAPPSTELHDYLKKSRILLTGVANLRTGGEVPIDLSLERRESRALVHQARDLRRQPLDPHSARLVSDLEKILIQLANTDERRDIPGIEIIRSGIRHKNLLFKIRMTESVLDREPNERKGQ